MRTDNKGLAAPRPKWGVRSYNFVDTGVRKDYNYRSVYGVLYYGGLFSI
jgi:hypothetical protein